MNYYDKVNQVDWFYIVIVLTQIPVGLFALYFVDFIGLKKTFWISTSLNVIGTGLRLGGITKLKFQDRPSAIQVEVCSTNCNFHQFEIPTKPQFFMMVQMMRIVIIINLT